MDTLLKDIRYGVRGLLKHPAFTALVVITLALNTLIQDIRYGRPNNRE